MLNKELYLKAISLLSLAPLSKNSLKEKLKNKCLSFAENDFLALSLELEKLGYLNDQALIEQSLAGKVKTKGFSYLEMKQFFFRHGFLDSDIKNSFNNYLISLEIDLEEWLKIQLANRIKKLKSKTREKQIASLTRFGFAYSLVIKVLNEKT